eukprot:2841203-Rhodomonas_salina.1
MSVPPYCSVCTVLLCLYHMHRALLLCLYRSAMSVPRASRPTPPSAESVPHISVASWLYQYHSTE